MKIAIVTATFPPYRGGTGNVAYHHARLMHERGHEVTVFTASQKNKDAQLPAFPFTVHYLSAIFRLGNAPLTPSLTKWLEGFDLIHLHYPYIFGAELTVRAASKRKIPIVVTYHNDLIASGVRGGLFYGYTRWVQPRLLKSASMVMATSADYAQHSFLKNVRGLSIQAVANGVDIDRFVPGDGVRPKGIPNKAPWALFVGALDKAHHFKGLPVLLKAVGELQNLHLAVVGDGDLKDSYRAQVADMGIEDRVHWMGAVNDDGLRDLYQGATVTVLPSTTLGEAFGLVLLESMACGTPVIASDLPGVRSVVPTGLNKGWLVVPGDAKQLAQAINTAIRQGMDENDRENLRNWVSDGFSWSIVGDHLEVVYGKLLLG